MEEFLLPIFAVLALILVIVKFVHILWTGKVDLPSNMPPWNDRGITRQVEPRLYWLTVILYLLFVTFFVFIAVSGRLHQKSWCA
jgi:hypothetical protein